MQFSPIVIKTAFIQGLRIYFEHWIRIYSCLSGAMVNSKKEQTYVLQTLVIVANTASDSIIYLR